MAKAPAMPPPGFESMPVQDKIEYVQRLWDCIAADAEHVPLLEWHKRVLDERLAEHRAHPDRTRPWAEVRRKVIGSLRDRRRRR